MWRSIQKRAGVVLFSAKLEQLREKWQKQSLSWPRRKGLLLLRLDLTDPESIHKALVDTLARFGTVEAVVNNAGYGLVGPFEGATPEQIERQLRTDLIGVMNVVREILPIFRKRGGRPRP